MKVTPQCSTSVSAGLCRCLSRSPQVALQVVWQDSSGASISKPRIENIYSNIRFRADKWRWRNLYKNTREYSITKTRKMDVAIDYWETIKHWGLVISEELCCFSGVSHTEELVLTLSQLVETHIFATVPVPVREFVLKTHTHTHTHTHTETTNLKAISLEPIYSYILQSHSLASP